MTEGETTILSELRAIREELKPIRDIQQQHCERLTRLEAATGMAGQVANWIVAGIVAVFASMATRLTGR